MPGLCTTGTSTPTNARSSLLPARSGSTGLSAAPKSPPTVCGSRLPLPPGIGPGPPNTPIPTLELPTLRKGIPPPPPPSMPLLPLSPALPPPPLRSTLPPEPVCAPPLPPVPTPSSPLLPLASRLLLTPPTAQPFD
ncbi:hypothetical protein Vretifemale_8600 [Volvox reticuliferus]|uniref:Uncharacterized protein n=1 Tax=Volvox reticuliferus TaxID=1737510 RepID=A0A8J4CB35_9CHLO|nr:hypothetical protein Vretifemale_8600 [Volvox reticuliferus]